ncbi:DNA-directed RNA polymerase III subunit RPC4 [Topomyia yanbarensis]|uniref:DNA-directed RNA polymerase III subunit RPC4 n=1 Tax=Topomyia yanbarensis TaxID=2498891 RepID=UPI00273AE46B|nr:DNA-directed RNA polymerase III subunit RPC4 [Topomyia yanbarensis]
MESTIKIKQEPGLKARGNATIAAATAQPAITVKSERLSSFRVPRDLTLGGLTNGRVTKPVTNKKVYTPNLNAVRNKDTNVKTASTGAKHRVKAERNKDTKGGAKNKGSLIQTAGIFSEGLAQRTLQRSKYEKYNNSSKEPGEAIRRPVYRTEVKVDPEEERKRISDLFGELENEEMTPEETKKYESGANMPVKLENLDYKLRPDTVKAEVKDELMSKTEASQLLDSIKASGTQNNFFLLQLPDALPGRTDSEVRKTDASSSQQQETDNVSESPRCTVRELEEGYVGKLLQYRSGKVKLILGKMVFDLTLGMDSGFLQELVSINTNPSERSGNIINLATIKAKLNASPDWEYLFNK